MVTQIEKVIIIGHRNTCTASPLIGMWPSNKSSLWEYATHPIKTLKSAVLGKDWGLWTGCFFPILHWWTHGILWQMLTLNRLRRRSNKNVKMCSNEWMREDSNYSCWCWSGDRDTIDLSWFGRSVKHLFDGLIKCETFQVCPLKCKTIVILTLCGFWIETVMIDRLCGIFEHTFSILFPGGTMIFTLNIFLINFLISKIL